MRLIRMIVNEHCTSFNTKDYILRVRELDRSNPKAHDANVLKVLNSMLTDGAPLWAVKNFLQWM